MDKAILKEQVQRFIKANLDSDLSKIILKGSPFPQVSIGEIADQISGLQKAKKKLPLWYDTEKIIFPPNLNLEQTSSEITANYKASLIFGGVLVDLTGGFGIDTFYFAQNFDQVIHCEINTELSQISAHNFQVLNRKNISTYQGDSIEFLKNSPKQYDWLYVDPSRRDDHGGRVFRLEHCTPNVVDFLDLFLKKATNLLIKTSPLLDIKAGLNGLEMVSELHIVAVNNEVKELLWIVKREKSGATRIHTINYLQEEAQEFQAQYEAHSTVPTLSLPQRYLYEPNPAIMKSGMFSALSRQSGAAKLHVNSHLYTSESLLEFPGRRFEVKDLLPYNKKGLRKLKYKKANITIRNFPKTVATIRKELNIEDGGSIYLFFTTNLQNEKIVLVCGKV